MLKFMLDTNIAIYVIKRRPMEVMELFNKHASQICISAISVAELLHGVEKTERPEQNLFGVAAGISSPEAVAELVNQNNKEEYRVDPQRVDEYGSQRRTGCTLFVRELHPDHHYRAKDEQNVDPDVNPK